MKKTTFTPEEDKILRDKYLEVPVSNLATLLGRSFTGVDLRLKKLGLIIPEEVKKERMQKNLFKVGSEPANKGKKMSAELYEKLRPTFFSKGHTPHNTKKDWEEVKRKDSSGYEYWMVKLPENRRLILKHVWLWERVNGKVKQGYNVVFKNGNTLDCRIENLECISRAELMSRNTLHRFPEDLKTIIQLKGVLTRQINKIQRNGENK